MSKQKNPPENKNQNKPVCVLEQHHCLAAQMVSFRGRLGGLTVASQLYTYVNKRKNVSISGRSSLNITTATYC